MICKPDAGGVPEVLVKRETSARMALKGSAKVGFILNQAGIAGAGLYSVPRGDDSAFSADLSHYRAPASGLSILLRARETAKKSELTAYSGGGSGFDFRV